MLFYAPSLSVCTDTVLLKLHRCNLCYLSQDFTTMALVFSFAIRPTSSDSFYIAFVIPHQSPHNIRVPGSTDSRTLATTRPRS